MSEKPQKNIGGQQKLSERLIPKVYSKQNSFSGIRHRFPVGDILLRVQKVLDNLTTFALSEYQREIIESACHDLLKKPGPLANSRPFALYSYNIDAVVE